MKEMELNSKLMKLVIEVKEDMDRYGIPYDENTTFSINGRLSRSLGRCIYLRKENKTRIEIQRKYLEFGELQEIKDTICHELIHSYKGCWNCGHKGLWKQLADEMTYRSHGMYCITRTTYTSESYNSHCERTERVYTNKYKITCKGCGNEFYRKKESKFIRYLKSEYSESGYYTCARCGSKKFDLYVY